MQRAKDRVTQNREIKRNEIINKHCYDAERNEYGALDRFFSAVENEISRSILPGGKWLKISFQSTPNARLGESDAKRFE